MFRSLLEVMFPGERALRLIRTGVNIKHYQFNNAKQGLILCFIAGLKHIIDLDLFLELINFFKKLAEEDTISKALFKLIIRRLKEYDCDIEEY